MIVFFSSLLNLNFTNEKKYFKMCFVKINMELGQRRQNNLLKTSYFVAFFTFGVDVSSAKMKGIKLNVVMQMGSCN